MRKMLVAMAADLRVLVIKLADRLHNMRTIAAMPHEKQQRIANETIDIYAPLAHRLGMQEIKQHLEDLSFAALHPKRYAELDYLVSSRSPEREVYLAAADRRRSGPGSPRSASTAEVTGRGKHLWSLYEKMVVKGREFDDIFDLVAMRIIVDSTKDCYAALGLHPRSLAAGGGPVQGLHRDAQVQPLPELAHHGHRPAGQADRGADPHPRDAPAGRVGRSPPTGRTRTARRRADIDWLNRIIDWQADVTDPAQFMQSLKTDLEQEEVFVFTPKGRVVTLPLGSTTVDFAYAVHTEVGHACVGAKVNGRLVSLDHQLDQRRHVRDLHVEGRDGRAVAGLAGVRQVAAGPQQDPAVVQPRAAHRHDRERPRGAHRRVPPGGPADAADVVRPSS